MPWNSYLTIPLDRKCAIPRDSADRGEFYLGMERRKRLAMIAAFAELVIPETDIPGALSADVPSCLERVVLDKPEESLRRFDACLSSLDRLCLTLTGGESDFAGAPTTVREGLVSEIFAQARTLQPLAEILGWLYYETIGYYLSSEVGQEALGPEVPELYRGCTHAEHQRPEDR